MTTNLSRGARAALIAALITFLGGEAAAAQGAPSSSGWWSKCVAIHDDRQRLECFDVSVPKDDPSSRDAEVTPTAIEAPAEVSTPVAKDETDWRVSAGYGLGVAGHAGSFKTLGGRLRSDSGFGTEGETIDAQLWRDGWIARDWSVGIEYLHLQNSGGITLNLPNGISILTNPVQASASGSIEGDAGFANIAWRPLSDGLLQADVGAGLGVGSGHAKSDIVVDNAFLGLRTSVSRASSLFAAPQAFADFDVPVYSHYYLDLGAKALFVTGHPVGLDQRYLDFILSISVGRKF